MPRACEAHLKSCAGCAAEYEQLRPLRGVFEDPALRYTAPAGLRERIEAALPVTRGGAPSRASPGQRSARASAPRSPPRRAWC